MTQPPYYLLLSNMYPSDENPGYGVFVKNMEDGLKANGVRVDHVVIKGRAKSVPSKIFVYMRYILAATFKLLQKKYDLVYVHFISFSALPLIICWPFVRAKIVFNAHGSDLQPDSLLKTLGLKAVSPFMSKIDLLVLPSYYYKAICDQRFPDTEKYVSPSAGVDSRIFYPRKGRDWREDNYTIGYVSRIDPGKGWKVLVKAISLLKPEILRKIKVTIVGGGSQQEQLEKLISQTGLNQVVSYVGLKPQSELGDLYRSFDIFVFPSERESLGLVGLESLSCGIPVIASNIPGLKEYIDHGTNGWLFPPDSPEHLADLISSYVELAPSIKERISYNALVTARDFERGMISAKLSYKLQSLLACP